MALHDSAAPTDPILAKVAELVTGARKGRVKANTGEGHEALDAAELLVEEDSLWRLRIDIERVHHLSRTGGTTAAVALADRCVVWAVASGDPVLRALAVRERDRLTPAPAGALEILKRELVLIDAALPLPNVWSVSPGSVFGMLAIRLSTRLGEEGKFTEKLAVLERTLSHPHRSKFWAASAYRRVATTYRTTADFFGMERTLDMLLVDLPNLGVDGQATLFNIQANQATYEARWGDAERLFIDAADATTSLINKGNWFSSAAYYAIRAGNLETAKVSIDRAEEVWKNLAKDAVTGMVLVMRRRAAIHAAQRNWNEAFEEMERLFSTYGTRPLSMSVLTLVELICDALADGFAVEQLSVHSFQAQTNSVMLSDFVALAERLDLLYDDLESASARARAAVAIGRLQLRSGKVYWNNLAERLDTGASACEQRRQWWRAGRTRLVLARVLDAEGDTDSAARNATTAIQHWSNWRDVSREEDRAWQVRHEVDNYLFAWRLAIKIGNPELAIRAAEALRGSAVAALLEDKQLVQTDLGIALSRNHTINAAEDELLAEGDQFETLATSLKHDDGAGDNARETRAWREATGAALAINRQSLGTDVRFIAEVVESGSLAHSLGPTTADWTVWIDFSDGQALMASRSSTGQDHCAAVDLSADTQRFVQTLNDPGLVAQLVSGPLEQAHLRALRDLGSALTSGPLSNALADSQISNNPVLIHISPGSEAWAVPWQAALIHDDPLVSRAVITLVPSRACASLLAKRKTTKVLNPVAIYDSTLEGAMKEASAFKSLWRTEPRTVLSGSGDFEGADAVIASVHGDYAGGGLRQVVQFPGLPTVASQLFSWTFPPLTIFGACWIGRLDRADSGDALGVALPVLVRGSRTMIGGLFGVHDDVTADVLIETYRGLHAGESPARALRDAQLQWFLENSTESRLPPLAAWAGLVAIGAH